MRSNTKDISSHDGPDATTAMSKPRVLIAAGGTGGHVYPAIAIADALRDVDESANILFVGTKDHLEWEAVPRAGYNILSIWISGFHRRFTLKNLLFPFKLVTSLIQSYRIISSFKPDVAISCGGYVAGPVCWTAAQKNIPVVIQEQNSYPGVTNRLIAKHASKIFTAFKDAGRFFPEEKINLSGNPTRTKLIDTDRKEAYDYFDFSESLKTLLVLGGSGGAQSINEAMKRHIDKLHDELNLQIIWQCGRRYYDQLKSSMSTRKYENLRLMDFIYDMSKAYAAADLVISRAGALSCSELQLTGKPSILVPSPNVAGDHQTKNARSMVENGAAELLKDEDAKDILGELVEQLISKQEKLKTMQREALALARPNAAKQIAQEVLALINKINNE